MDLTIDIQIPSGWDELTDAQMIALAKVSHLRGEAFDLAVWLILNESPAFDVKRKKAVSLVLELVTLSELKKTYNYIYQENLRRRFVSLKGYRAPLDVMFDLTIERYSYADDLNNLFLETKDYKYLKHLACVIYSKKNEAFDWTLQNTRVKRFDRFSNACLFAVHLCFNGCKNNLKKKYPKVFPELTGNGSAKKRGSFMDVVLSMSGQKFGSYQETKCTLLHTFMDEFNNTILLQEKWKER